MLPVESSARLPAEVTTRLPAEGGWLRDWAQNVACPKRVARSGPLQPGPPSNQRVDSAASAGLEIQRWLQTDPTLVASGATLVQPTVACQHVAVGTAAIVLDHLAVAMEQPSLAWPRYRDQLGGRWASTAGVSSGFEFSQVEFAGGMKIEVLSPYDIEQNDFLRRFLDHSGPGPHHLTFKVPSLGATLERCRSMGYRTVGERRDDPNWQEAFLHPKDGAGVVIQLAQEGEDDEPDPLPDALPDALPEHWPGDPDGPSARMEFVAHAVTEFHSHVRRFTELLDGRIDATGTDPALGADTMDLVWPNDARIRLLRPASPSSELVSWLGDRHARVHHAAFSGLANPGFSHGERIEIAPQDNHGLRLIIT